MHTVYQVYTGYSKGVSTQGGAHALLLPGLCTAFRVSSLFKICALVICLRELHLWKKKASWSLGCVMGALDAM